MRGHMKGCSNETTGHPRCRQTHAHIILPVPSQTAL